MSARKSNTDTRNAEAQVIVKDARELARKLEIALSATPTPAIYAPDNNQNPATLAYRLAHKVKAIERIWHPKEGS